MEFLNILLSNLLDIFLDILLNILIFTDLYIDKMIAYFLWVFIASTTSPFLILFLTISRILTIQIILWRLLLRGCPDLILLFLQDLVNIVNNDALLNIILHVI